MRASNSHAGNNRHQDATLASDLYALVVFLHKNCNADLFEAVGTLELSLSQIKLLQHFDDEPRELSLKQAAEVVHVSMPAASRMVDDLVRRGFAQRREDDDDRRMKRVGADRKRPRRDPPAERRAPERPRAVRKRTDRPPNGNPSQTLSSN